LGKREKTAGVIQKQPIEIQVSRRDHQKKREERVKGKIEMLLRRKTRAPLKEMPLEKVSSSRDHGRRERKDQQERKKKSKINPLRICPGAQGLFPYWETVDRLLKTSKRLLRGGGRRRLTEKKGGWKLLCTGERRAWPIKKIREEGEKQFYKGVWGKLPLNRGFEKGGSRRRGKME